MAALRSVGMPALAAEAPSPRGRGGETSIDDLRQVVLAANSDGIDLLRRGRPQAAFEQLKYAEAVLAANPEVASADGELLAMTCSNLGCYYRKAGFPRASLRYLGRALKVEEDAAHDAPQDACSLATTKLNACAALSSVGNHEEAETLAQDAARLLVAQIAGEEAGNPPRREQCALLAVACHNLGAEREHLGNWAGAAVAFRQGSEVAGRALGPGSTMTRALAENCAEALSKAERHPTTPDRPAVPRPCPGGRKKQWRSGAFGKAAPSSSTGRRAAAHAAWAAVAAYAPEAQAHSAAGQKQSMLLHKSSLKGGLGDWDDWDDLDDEDTAVPELPSLSPLSRSTTRPGEREDSLEQWGEVIGQWHKKPARQRQGGGTFSSSPMSGMGSFGHGRHSETPRGKSQTKRFSRTM